MSPPDFVLASASVARRKLLRMAGIEPIICPSNFDESRVKSTDPKILVQTLALRKATTVSSQYSKALILGCDSVLAIEDRIYGKPNSPATAIARWQEMRGREGLLYTGHALIDSGANQEVLRCGITKVYFANISDREIAAYVATSEPLKCAGSFALEGQGGLFVEKIDGCHTNVIGLSLPLLRTMLADLGYQVTDFWQNP
ncbi:MAG: nucleoside triphosphate pyrophosphatase [Prochloraceae cyanobacterium]|nr:nucleoside triphosphate pyrophosphatase [Prochloraceae cyanobacterium]